MRQWCTLPFFGLLCVSGLLFTVATAVLASSGGNDLVPTRIYHGPVTAKNAPDLLFYESTHNLNVGDKGQESFNLSVQRPACGQQALVFHRARLVYKRQRFGAAKITRSPPSGCFDCPPLIVDWYHEPTGYVDFQVHIYRKMVQGYCP